MSPRRSTIAPHEDRPTGAPRRDEATEQAQFYAQVLEAVGDSVIFTDLQGRIRYWNRGAEEVFGYSATEMLGRTPALLYPNADPESLAADLEAVLAGEEYVGTWRGRRKDGATVWVDVKTSVARDAAGTAFGFLGVAKDATARVRAQEALAKSERRYRLVSQASREALWEWDLASDRVEWSAGAESILGYDPGAVSPNGALGPACMHPDDRMRVETGLTKALADRADTWTDQYRIRRKNGTYAVVSDRAYIERDADGTPIRVVGAVADITERTEAEEHLRQADRLEAVGRLAGGIAHDLNNMLTSILGWSEYLARALAPGSMEATELGHITKAANRAAKLTQQLLAFARRDNLQPRPTDLNIVVAEAATLLRPLLPSRIDLHLALSASIGPILVDRSRIEQAIVNLVLNARDAIEAEGKVTVETGSVILDTDYIDRHAPVKIQPGRYSLLAVSDTGHGMDRETLSRIFEPFYTTKPVGRGTGLGLATVYGSVKQAGGFVWAYSEPGIGTVVKVYLPEIDAQQANHGGSA
jgi:PAS domain S-box-containing protein